VIKFPPTPSPFAGQEHILSPPFSFFPLQDADGGENLIQQHSSFPPPWTSSCPAVRVFFFFLGGGGFSLLLFFFFCFCWFFGGGGVVPPLPFLSFFSFPPSSGIRAIKNSSDPLPFRRFFVSPSPSPPRTAAASSFSDWQETRVQYQRVSFFSLPLHLLSPFTNRRRNAAPPSPFSPPSRSSTEEGAHSSF